MLGLPLISCNRLVTFECSKAFSQWCLHLAGAQSVFVWLIQLTWRQCYFEHGSTADIGHGQSQGYSKCSRPRYVMVRGTVESR